MTHVRRKTLAALLVMAALSMVPQAASAAGIQFTATDLADVNAGEDLWEYEYFVSGIAFLADQGFAVYASDGLYADLAIVDPPAADWDALAIQPDAVLNSPGAYDALALIDGPSLLGPFKLQFVWLGAGTPGSQPFDIYGVDATGAYEVLDQGRTVRRSVPEPAVLGLCGVAGLVAAACGRRRITRA